MRKSPGLFSSVFLLLVWASSATDSKGLRGKRKSCSVVVGFMAVEGLEVAIGDIVLAAML
ncbi:hypothetical protein PC116_g31231 [Phytophthora cactorum]|nr:hypothetical protein PC116_g31231 [Phytophthora cactorum]